MSENKLETNIIINENIKIIIESFINNRNEKIYYECHYPLNNNNNNNISYPSLFLFLHGLAEHLGRYKHVFKYIIENLNIPCFALDHHGHGQSEGYSRVNCKEFNNYIEDIIQFIEIIYKKVNFKYLILSGISFGGLLASHVAFTLHNNIILKKYDFHLVGIILIAPAVGIEMNRLQKVQKPFVKIWSKLTPEWRAIPAVKPQDLCRNEEAIQEYINDPLCMTGNTKVKMAYEILNGMDSLNHKKNSFIFPLLILHGNQDKIINPICSKKFIESIPSLDKEYKEFPNLFHCLFHEKEKEEIMEYMIQWIKKRNEINITDIH